MAAPRGDEILEGILRMHSGHELSLPVEPGHRHEFKAPVIWVEHVRALVFNESNDATFQLGAMHAIEWGPLLSFLPHILKLTCHLSGLDQACFTVTPAFHFEQGRRVAKPGVGIFENEGVIICEEKRQELEVALTCFCRGVLQGQEVTGQDQLFPIELTERSAESVAALVVDFLKSSGGKKVGEARMLKTNGTEILIAGTYRPIKDKSLPGPTRRTVMGQIDGLRGATRTVFVNLSDRKTAAVLFDESRFKQQLRARVLDGLIYAFVIETEWISNDKTVDTLVSFSPCGGSEPVLL